MSFIKIISGIPGFAMGTYCLWLCFFGQLCQGFWAASSNCSFAINIIVLVDDMCSHRILFEEKALSITNRKRTLWNIIYGPHWSNWGSQLLLFRVEIATVTNIIGNFLNKPAFGAYQLCAWFKELSNWLCKSSVRKHLCLIFVDLQFMHYFGQPQHQVHLTHEPIERC